MKRPSENNSVRPAGQCPRTAIKLLHVAPACRDRKLWLNSLDSYVFMDLLGSCHFDIFSTEGEVGVGLSRQDPRSVSCHDTSMSASMIRNPG